MSADGAMIGLQTGEWVEVRTLVIGEIAPQEKKKNACKSEPRVEKPLLRHNPLLLTPPSLPPPPLPTPDPLPVAPAVPFRSGSSRPSAHHPWRRPFKPGQTLPQKDVAKM